MFCLTGQYAELFKQKLISGEINPEILNSMTSAERRQYFKEIIGDNNAKEVNALFESKLLLKNQQQGIINWAKQVVGIKNPVYRDILSRVNKMTEVLNPQTEKAFLEDLVAHRLGTTVTMEEASKISELAKEVQDLKGGPDRLAYGRARVAFGNYINALKEGADKKTLSDILKTPLKSISEVAGATKSIRASMDNSAIFRQGWKTLWTNPGTWLKNAKQSFVDLVKTFGGKEVLDEVQADIVSRPTYDLMQKAKLAVGTIEEAYPSHLNKLTNLPVVKQTLGKAYKASEAAYTGFVYRMRADVFDKYLEIAEKTGVNIQDEAELKAIGKLVNSLTGRGSLGPLEPSANFINNVFFSPRFIKSNFDTLTAHQFQKGVTPFVRKQAAENLLKIIGGTATILTIANAVKPGSIEKDSRSSDFGKIKIGDTRFDVTGGMAGLVILASRLISHATKSSTSGTITPLDTGKFGAPTTQDQIYNFFESKLSPASQFILQLRTGKDFSGNPVSPGKTLLDLITPLPITTYQELKSNPNSANIILSLIADALGIGTNTYSPKKSSTNKGLFSSFK